MARCEICDHVHMYSTMSFLLKMWCVEVLLCTVGCVVLTMLVKQEVQCMRHFVRSVFLTAQRYLNQHLALCSVSLSVPRKTLRRFLLNPSSDPANFRELETVRH